MEFQDKHLTCVDCGTEFIWTAGEQTVLRGQELQERAEALQGVQGQACQSSGRVRGMRERVETATNCSACGKETTVPFKPTQGRPVFCKECFQQRKFAGAGGA